MIQQGLTPQVNGNGNGRADPAPIRLAMVMANSLDCDAMSTLLAQQQRIDVLETSTDLEFSLAQCRQLFPQVLIVDPKVAIDIPQRAGDMVRRGFVRHAIVLDDRLHEGRLAAVLPLPSVSYVTRQTGFAALVSTIVRGAIQGERSFDPAFADRVRRTPRGWRLEKAHDRPSVASLTSRELEVMELLARGHTVRDCAKQLKLAESTIDNHKARLMKKLQVHKAAELTHLAIRDGIIAV